MPNIKKTKTGLNQTEIANIIGCDKSLICHIFNRNKPCPVNLAPLLRELTGVSEMVLLYGNKEELHKELYDSST